MDGHDTKLVRVTLEHIVVIFLDGVTVNVQQCRHAQTLGATVVVVVVVHWIRVLRRTSSRSSRFARRCLSG